MQRGILGASAPPRSLPGARELAGLLLELCELGISRRAQGTCLGVGVASRLAVDRDGLRLRGPRGPLSRWIGRLRAVRHAARGHDAGCHAFGISLREIDAAVRRFGGVRSEGTTALLLEGIGAAEAEVRAASAERGAWSAHETQEALEFHLRRRITPVTSDAAGWWNAEGRPEAVLRVRPSRVVS